MNYNKPGQSKSNAGFGIVTGLCQVTYGLIYKDDCPKTDRNTFLTLNVGLGTLAILTSTLRLLKKEHKNTNLTSWNLFYKPIKTNNFEIGIMMTRKI